MPGPAPTSSSSADCGDALNPENSRRLLNLVVDGGSWSSTIPAGGVVLQGGANTEFVVGADTNDVVLNVVPGGGTEDPYFRTKFQALAGILPGESSSGSSETVDKPAWMFTDQTVYIAALNGVGREPLSGAVFVVGDACNTAGEFSVPGHPSWPQDRAAALTLLDICTPCVDCLTYHQLEEYLDRIRSFFDYTAELCLNETTVTPPPPPSGLPPETFSGTLPQVMASLRYWDYLVHQSTVKLAAQSYGQSVVAAGFYRNISNTTVGSGTPDFVKLVITFAFEIVSGGTVTPWAGISSAISDVRLLDRSGRCSAVLAPAGVVFGSNTVRIETTSGHDLSPGQEVYSDVALVLLGSALGNVPGENYRITVTLDVSPTHMDPVTTRSTVVYFRPPDAAPSSTSGAP